VIFLLGGVMVALANGAWPAFKQYGFTFLTSQRWNPVKDLWGLPANLRTVVSSLVAMLIAAPVGIGIAIFLTESCPRACAVLSDRD